MSGSSVRVCRALLVGLVLLLPACSAINADEDYDVAAETPAVAPDTPQNAPQQEVRVVPDMHPDQLLGLDADQLTAMLGPADFRRADGPAEIWQYRNGACVLDLFLYTSRASGDWQVAHVDVRDRTMSASAEASDCATALLRQRRQQAG